MILLICLIPIILIAFKLILGFIVKVYGKFSYDGFSSFGFIYISEEDVFYTAKNAWQKNMGYTYFYDELAPLFNMILDTERVCFKYNNYSWLITFWKGQYGICTGAEIGVYKTSLKKVNKHTLYYPLEEKDYLRMSYALYKNEKKLFQVQDRHWWLAVFKLGVFSKLKELKMVIKIEFLDTFMLEAFLEAFLKLGYDKRDYKTEDNTFYFIYDRPHTRKVWTRLPLSDYVRQKINERNVRLYNSYLGLVVDNNGIDDSKSLDEKLVFVSSMVPFFMRNEEVGHEE